MICHQNNHTVNSLYIIHRILYEFYFYKSAKVTHIEFFEQTHGLEVDHPNVSLQGANDQVVLGGVQAAVRDRLPP